ncbi:unnamed protein product [Boreogadus saida]
MDVVRQQACRLHRGIHLQTTGTLIKEACPGPWPLASGHSGAARWKRLRLSLESLHLVRALPEVAPGSRPWEQISFPRPDPQAPEREAEVLELQASGRSAVVTQRPLLRGPVPRLIPAVLCLSGGYSFPRESSEKVSWRKVEMVTGCVSPGRGLLGE